MPLSEKQLYKRIKLLGEGSYGQAYLAHSFKTDSLVVIKQIDMQWMSHKERKETTREAKILSSLKHPNIVACHEVYQTKKGLLCIVMEYADRNFYLIKQRTEGDLHNLIKLNIQQKSLIEVN